MLACRDGQYDDTPMKKCFYHGICYCFSTNVVLAFLAVLPWSLLRTFVTGLSHCGFSLYHAFLWRQIFIWRVKVWKAATPLNSCIEMEIFIHPSIHPSMSTYLRFCNDGSKQSYSRCPSPQHHFQFGLVNPETFPGQVRSLHWILGLPWCHLSVECAWKKFPGDPLTGYPNYLNHIFKTEQRYPAEETSTCIPYLNLPVITLISWPGMRVGT